MSDTQTTWEYEQSIRDRALALCDGVSPYYNIHPLMELIREADRLGFDINKPTASSPNKS